MERNKNERSLNVFGTASLSDSNSQPIVEENIEIEIPPIYPELPRVVETPITNTSNLKAPVPVNGLTIAGFHFSITNVLLMMILFVTTVNAIKK